MNISPNYNSTSAWSSLGSMTDGYTGEDDFSPSTPSSQSAGLISKDSVRAVENVINIGVLPVLVIVGVTTNVINMVVFKRQGLGDRINICLFSLSLADLGYLLFMMAGKAHSVLTLLHPPTGQHWKVRGLHTVVGIYWGFVSTSNVITMIIALERCACVLAPLHAKRLLRARSMAVLVGVVFVVILGLYGVYNVKYITVTRTGPDGNVQYVAGLGSFYLQHRAAINAVYNYILSITIPTTSLVVVIISTMATVIQLRLSLAWRKGMQSASTVSTADDTREAALTRMLVVICCVYVVCTTPTVTKALMVQMWPDFLPSGRYNNMFYVVNAFVHVLSVTNSSVNFFFYCALGTRYRACLKTLSICRYCCCFGWPHRDKTAKGGLGAGRSEVSSDSGPVTVLESVEVGTTNKPY